MNLFKRRKKQTRPATRAIFDIRPRSVSVALVQADNGRQRVLWSKRRSVRPNEHDHGDLHRRAVCRTLEEVLEDMETDGRARLRAISGDDYIEAMRFVLASPWSRDQVVSSRVSQPRQFLLNRDHVYSAGRVAYNDFSDKREHDLLPLSQRIVALRGDGNLIQFPHETPIRELELSMHVSKLPKDIKAALERIARRYHHPDKLSFHSAADAANRVFSRVFEHPTDFLIILPEHTQTDIIFVEAGKLVGITSFPIGEDFLWRAMSQAFSRPVDDVHGRLRLYHQGRLAHERDNIEIALGEISRRWKESFRQAIGELTNTPPRYNYLLTQDREYKAAFEGFFADTFSDQSDVQTYVVDDDLFTDHFLAEAQVDCTLAVSILGVEVY